uniref:Immunoglobulin V-set domain-containing protein n=1 Tax=Oryzias latipes TaxID=8090 RepID=A0A3P9JBY5_ORYLA
HIRWILFIPHLMFDKSTLEGASVTLSYKYPKLSTNSYFFWYGQFQGKPPEFLVSHSSSGQIGITNTEGLKIQVENKQIDLQISSAAVSDSAVYYCALQPTVTGNNKTLYKNLQQQNTTTSTRGRSNIKKVHVLRNSGASRNFSWGWIMLLCLIFFLLTTPLLFPYNLFPSF